MPDLEVIASAGSRASLDISRLALPPRLRPAAELGVLDITEFFGETTGGVRTYLLQKARYVQRRASLRQTIVVPGARDEILEASGVRCYRLHGPATDRQSLEALTGEEREPPAIGREERIQPKSRQRDVLSSKRPKTQRGPGSVSKVSPVG